MVYYKVDYKLKKKKKRRCQFAYEQPLCRIIQIASTQSHLDENRTIILNNRSLVMSTSDIPRPYWRPHYLLVSSAYNIGLAKKFPQTFWCDVTEKPNGHFCQPCISPQKSLWEKRSTTAIRFQHTEKRNLTD